MLETSEAQPVRPGYRIYSERDLETLEEIVALKFVGVPLKQIIALRNRPTGALGDILRAQRVTLEAKQRRLTQAIGAVAAAEAALCSGSAVGTELSRRIIEVMKDTSIDFREDTPGYPKKDPDTHSRKLREYHKFLWSKPLPDGRAFTLDAAVPGHYLYHCSEIGEFSLASDSVIPTFTRWGFAAAHPELVTAEENEAFMTIAYTIGGMMLFPRAPINRKWTINQARGCLRKISDRLDLTVECIRRHYLGLDDASRLGETLDRYRGFFALFASFSGYVDFFLLQDLVTDDYSAVRFFMPFDDFKTSSVPTSVDTQNRPSIDT